MPSERTLLRVFGAITVLVPAAFALALFSSGDTATLDDFARRAAFERIYAIGGWGKDERGKGTSGGGSSLEATRLYRFFLRDFMVTHRIRSVVDAGCGDWEFSQAIDWTGIEYLGVDIVPSVIEANRRRFSKPNIRFAVADIVRDELPPADLLLVKDVLQHLSNADIARFARQFGRYRHVLFVNDVDGDSLTAEPTDISSGGHRLIDPTQPPHSLPGRKMLMWRSVGPSGAWRNAKLVVHLTPGAGRR